MALFYAGVGNRYGVPMDMIELMKEFATVIASVGYVLRSGGAIGCDLAFESAALETGGTIEIYKAKQATSDSIEYASHFHPAWDACTPFVKQLHGRNAMIILGPDLKTKVSFLVCYAVDEKNGGTALGIKIARANNIPVYNLAKAEGHSIILDMIFCLKQGIDVTRMPLI